MYPDFTEDRYCELLKLAKQRFRFIRFDEAAVDGAIALWHHDIDMSPQRAVALAEIEAVAEITATYFIQLTSRFYSVFEKETAVILRQISALGHVMGLHFDPDFYEAEAVDTLIERLRFEISVLETLIGTSINVFTLHNPTTIQGYTLDQIEYHGLINGSAPFFYESFVYCSDSNGFWRYRTPESVLTDQTVNRIHVLTHPEWWQKNGMKPRARVQRCIDGRARFCEKYYDGLLRHNQRRNIGKEE